MTFNSSNYQKILENISKYGTKNVKMVAVSKNPGAEGSGDEEQTEGNQVENDEKTKETLKNN